MSQDYKKLIHDTLLAIGEDPDREGLVDTPKRVIKSWEKLFGGYKMSPESILSTKFSADEYDQMIILKDIEFYSTCEHHMLPFFGKVHIGYIPSSYVVGISKLARLVECFSRRLQIQERMTSEIATSIQTILECNGCMVVVEAQHFCMVSRGVEKKNSIMSTSHFTEVFKQESTRNEFLRLIGK